MKYLRLFNEHSAYTEAMQTLEAPNVSHCVGENHVHYKPELPSVLPGNEEVWELYSSLICDDEILAEDLENKFSNRIVSVTSYTESFYENPRDSQPMYTLVGYKFTCDPETRIIFTGVSFTNVGASTPQAVTNDCGQDIIRIEDWQEMGSVIPIDPGVS